MPTPASARVPFAPIALALFAVLFPLAALSQSGNPAPMTPVKNPDPRVAPVLEEIQKARNPGALALSPDGTLLAWTLGGRRAGGQIHLTEVAHPDAQDHTVAAPAGSTDCAANQPTWSADGGTLAFLSTCTGDTAAHGQQQILLWSRKSGQTRQLTHITGEIQALAWSPDSRSIGFLFVENATRSAGALAAMKPWSGVVGEDGVEVQRVAVARASSGEVTQVTPPNLHVYEFDWAPGSRELTYVAANPPGENNWWVAQLYTQEIGGAARPRSVLDITRISGELHNLQIANPRFSPDGKRIAFIGGLMSDQGSTGGDIYTIPATGGTPRDVMPDRTVSAAWIEWTGKTNIRYVARKAGGNQISVFNADTGKDLTDATEVFQQTIRAGEDAVTSSRNGAYAFTASSFDAPPEIYISRGPRQPLKQLTHLNSGLKPVWGKSESIEWENDGFRVQGWLLYPVNYDPAKKYPLIVNVHGGPSSAIGSGWGQGGALYSALGYFSFSPNPRGSYGQGEKFTQANVKDFGYGDLKDILAGMDVLEKRFSIDKDREGLTGWSYGGFMTMFGVTQTTRFRAAVAGAGISDWKSYYGENSIDQWMLPFFGKTVYDDPEVYAKSSAIEYIKNVKTPTLVIVGDRDGECPAPQSFEFWHALRAEGVKTQLVIYPNEGHGFRDPAHILDRTQRTFQWFEQQMPATGQTPSQTASR
jgi:dipeptidyl aminopeptidase/acylaminoacyl peptidase